LSNIKNNSIIAAMRNEAARTCTVAVPRYSHSRNSRILFAERFELSVAIERLKLFELEVVGPKRSGSAIELVQKVKSELGLKEGHSAAMRRFNSSKVQSTEINGTYAVGEQSDPYFEPGPGPGKHLNL
jgi:hypothetical protein